MNLPVALTCGDPNGIGIDISFDAKKELKNKKVRREIPPYFFYVPTTSIFFKKIDSTPIF